MAKQKTHKIPTIETVIIGAGAVDIGSREHMAAVNPEVTDAPVRAFGTFTHDLHDLADWFKSHGVTSVAKESTGVYWIPAYEILEQHGFEVILVNARYAAGFDQRPRLRPCEPICASVNGWWNMQRPPFNTCRKALMEMNLQLRHVVSDITGITGMKIICGIVVGERDLDMLSSYRDVRCKASTETIKAALNGNDPPEHIFALTQSLELYDFYQAKMLECDRHLEATLAVLGSDTEYDPSKLPRPRTKTKQVSTPSFDVRTALLGVLGVDLTQIHGMGLSLSLKLVGKCGTDLCAWLSAKNFTSWLCLAPGNKISGGKVLSSRTRRSSSRAAYLLRLAAVTIGRSDTALGAF
ncbi:transposase [uncultured Sulfitobacter sp.]|uniref:IS110 family transposase n=1 Tax=uncultured Sulfitobacter sp. TaxID=191468 RepID=UPI0030DA4036|tara:strand:+ start:15148 stop:16203 length:1056 start_codon:yes stop_codon:yes gene_type:complete